jgi:hypothetical protein
MNKSLITGFFIGVLLYIFIFGMRVIKVLIRARWNFEMIQHGLYNTFSEPFFAIGQIITLILCIAGSITLYYYYRAGFFQK